MSSFPKTDICLERAVASHSVEGAGVLGRYGYRVYWWPVPAGTSAGLSVFGSCAKFAAVGASTFPAACQHKELRQKQAKMSHSAPKYSEKKQMHKLALLTLEPQEGVWHGLASAARPEKSHLVGKVGLWKGRAKRALFIIHTESQTDLDWKSL